MGIQFNDFISGMVVGYIVRYIQEILDAIKFRIVHKLKDGINDKKK